MFQESYNHLSDFGKENLWKRFPHGTLVSNKIEGKTGVVLPHPDGDQNLMVNTFWVMYRKDGQPITQEDADSLAAPQGNYEREKYQGFLTNPKNCASVGKIHVPLLKVSVSEPEMMRPSDSTAA